MTDSDKDKLFAARDFLLDGLPIQDFDSLDAIEIYDECRFYLQIAAKIINRRMATYYDVAVVKEKAEL